MVCRVKRRVLEEDERKWMDVKAKRASRRGAFAS